MGGGKGGALVGSLMYYVNFKKILFPLSILWVFIESQVFCPVLLIGCSIAVCL